MAISIEFIRQLTKDHYQFGINRCIIAAEEAIKDAARLGQNSINWPTQHPMEVKEYLVALGFTVLHIRDTTVLSISW